MGVEVGKGLKVWLFVFEGLFNLGFWIRYVIWVIIYIKYGIIVEFFLEFYKGGFS